MNPNTKWMQSDNLFDIICWSDSMFGVKQSVKWDWMIAIGLSILTVCVALCCLDGGSLWHDYAAYMNEAIAIAEGRFDEMTRMNLFMHPSDMTFLTEKDTSLVYSWGFPLMLAPIYLLLGFDRTNYGNIIYYKLPGVLCLGLTAFALFWLYRRRFSRMASILLTTLIVWNASLLTAANAILTDLPCLAFAVTSLLLAECFWNAQDKRIKWLYAILLGMTLWWTYVIRLNGITVLLLVLLAHLLDLWRKKPLISVKWMAEQLMPYLVLGFLLAGSNLFLPAATSNSADLLQVSLSLLLENIRFYLQLLAEWMGGLFAQNGELGKWQGFVGVMMVMLAILGVVVQHKRQDAHLFLLIVITIAGLLMLPYTQGIRYLFNALPFVLMYMAYGARFLYRLLLKGERKRLCLVLLTVLMTVSSISSASYVSDRYARRGDDRVADDAYTTFSIDVYRYIQQNTPEDSVFVFFKPRALYLNTGRLAFKPQVRQENILDPDYFFGYQPHYHAIEDADYVLLYLDDEQKQLAAIQSELQDPSTQLEMIYQNQFFMLYEIQK